AKNLRSANVPDVSQRRVDHLYWLQAVAVSQLTVTSRLRGQLTPRWPPGSRENGARRAVAVSSITAQPVEHDTDLLFSRVVLSGCPPNVADKVLGRHRRRVGFLSHLRSLGLR